MKWEKNIFKNLKQNKTKSQGRVKEKRRVSQIVNNVK